MKELFLLSGLGADRRVFDFLDLQDYKVHHIMWATPLRHESLTEYTKRLLPQISSKKPILIGVSFGGIVAQEIGKLIEVEKIILISSAKSPTAIPTYFKVIARFKIQKLIPQKALKQPNEILFWLFGISRREHRNLLAAIMEDTDEKFFSWAIETISLWNNKVIVDRVIQIHGTHDKLLKLQTADYIVEGGGHLMVVTHANEISIIIRKVLAQENYRAAQ
jgi:pimeloyl-ACP methyl ester carboxylesterase